MYQAAGGQQDGAGAAGAEPPPQDGADGDAGGDDVSDVEYEEVDDKDKK